MINISDVEIGETVHYAARGRSQKFTLIGFKPYVRKSDGGETIILEWTSNCLHCGEGYKFTSARVSMWPIRTCPAHRNGRRANGTNPRAMGTNPRALRKGKKS